MNLLVIYLWIKLCWTITIERFGSSSCLRSRKSNMMTSDSATVDKGQPQIQLISGLVDDQYSDHSSVSQQIKIFQR